MKVWALNNNHHNYSLEEDATGVVHDDWGKIGGLNAHDIIHYASTSKLVSSKAGSSSHERRSAKKINETRFMKSLFFSRNAQS